MGLLKNIKVTTILIGIIMAIFLCCSSKVQAATPTNYTRISGQTRFDTAEAIANKEVNGTITDVILASGNNFPDALSVSVLAKKLKAPVLLVDSTVESSTAAFNYIKANLQPTVTVHIIGGTGVISSNFEATLNSQGFNNIDRIGGFDRYNTDVLVANKLAVTKGTPVVIASGTSFPDVLSISSIAAAKGYPILLTERDSLSQDVLDFLTSDQPSKVYVVGGTAVIADEVQSAIQSSLTSPAHNAVTRIAGSDRFETNFEILSQFSMSPKTVYVASAIDFPDALAGSALAASTGDPIILIDPTASSLPQSVGTYLDSLYAEGVKPNITAFGGEAAVQGSDLSSISNILDGKFPNIIDPFSSTVFASYYGNDNFQGLHLKFNGSSVSGYCIRTGLCYYLGQTITVKIPISGTVAGNELKLTLTLDKDAIIQDAYWMCCSNPKKLAENLAPLKEIMIADLQNDRSLSCNIYKSDYKYKDTTVVSKPDPDTSKDPGLGNPFYLSPNKTAYDRDAALAYASEHWNDGVGECAQFVSACLDAGGLTGCGNKLCTPLFNNIMTQNLGKVVSVNEVEVGDLIFWGTSTKVHTAIVTTKSPLKVTQHNGAHLDIPIQYITDSEKGDGKTVTYVHMY